MKRITAKTPLTPAQVAELFGVNVKTVARWSRSGRLPSFRTPGGHRRYRIADVEAALNGGGGFAAPPEQPKIAIISWRDIRPLDVIDIDGRSAEVASRYPTEASPHRHLSIDWRAVGTDDPDRPPHRTTVRELTTTVPLLRRPNPNLPEAAS